MTTPPATPLMTAITQRWTQNTKRPQWENLMAVSSIDPSAWRLAAHPQPNQPSEKPAAEVDSQLERMGSDPPAALSNASDEGLTGVHSAPATAKVCAECGGWNTKCANTGDCVRPSAAPATVLTEEEQNMVTQLRQFRGLESENVALKTQLAEAKAASVGLKEQVDLYMSMLNRAQENYSNAKKQLAQRDKELAEAKGSLEIIQRSESITIENLRAELAAEKQAAGEAKKAYELAQAEADVEIERLTALLDAGAIGRGDPK